MIYSPPNIQGVAGGNINPSRVVCFSTVADNTFLMSASNTSPNFGIAQSGTHSAPNLTTANDGYAATSGMNIQVYGPGCVAPGELGGTVTRGDRLTSDSNGRLITTTTTGDQVVGWAIESGNLSDIAMVLVQPFTL